MESKEKNQANLVDRARTKKFEELIRKEVSQLKGSTREHREFVTALKNAARGVDRKALKRSTNFAHQLLTVLIKALPDTDQQLIGDFVAELTDLSDYGRDLNRAIKELCKMRLPRDRERMRDALLAIEVQQLYNALDCIKGLQKSLPKLKGAIR